VFWSDEDFHGSSWNGFADLSVLRTNGVNSFISITAAFLHGYLVFFFATERKLPGLRKTLERAAASNRDRG
jgi:hypothetical protein